MAQRISGRRNANPAWKCLAWAAVLVAPTIFAHELAHFATALALGFDPTLHFSAVDPGSPEGKPQWMEGLIGLAGPVMTLILIVAGIAGARRRPDAAWPQALAITAASRFAVGLPYTLISLVVMSSGQRLTPPAFDEYKAATALGWSGNLLLGITSIIPLLVLVWLVRSRPRESRLATLLALLVGTALGWYLWLGLLGPPLLP